MEYKPGDLILIPFPFSDLTSHKKRPALILKEKDYFGDFLAVPLTSQPQHQQSIELDNKDLSRGELPKKSWLRVDKIYTLNDCLIIKKIGTLKPAFFKRSKQSICEHIGCCYKVNF